MSSDIGPSDPTIDRRTLLKAGAWTTPVVMLATAVPASAASNSATGELIFTNLSYYWRFDDSGVVLGLTANTTVGFLGGTGTITSITLVVRIENADDQYQVGGVPVILRGAPAWTVVGTGTAIQVGGVPWIEYTFLWTGTLVSIAYTDLLEATVPLTVPIPTPPLPEGSAWTARASAPGNPGVLPATDNGTGVEFEDRRPVTP